MNCSPMFLFFILMNLKAFCVTQNETPKMEKMSVSPDKLSYFFALHANIFFGQDGVLYTNASPMPKLPNIFKTKTII